MNKNIIDLSCITEIARSHTPTITELHSESGSIQSTTGHRLSYTRPGTIDSRRLSTATIQKLSRITSTVHHKGWF